MYYIGIVTGALLLLGTLAVLGLGKHAVSPESDSINIKVPILGTIKTRNPMVFIACVGFALLITCYEMAQKDQLAAQKAESITVDGTIDSDSPVTVYFVAIPKAQYHQQGSGPIHTLIPKIDDATYRAEFVVGDRLADDQALTVANGHASLSPFTNAGLNAKTTSTVIPKVEVSDAAANAFLKQ